MLRLAAAFPVHQLSYGLIEPTSLTQIKMISGDGKRLCGVGFLARAVGCPLWVITTSPPATI